MPSGFHLKTSTDEQVIAAVKSNIENKTMFQRTTGLGKLGFDTENNIFHIDNAYYKVYQLEGYSFYTSEPRLDNIGAVADVYFSYTPIGEERRVRRIKSSARCHYERNSTAITVEPPPCMMIARQQFQSMIEVERDRIMQTIQLETALRKNGQS